MSAVYGIVEIKGHQYRVQAGDVIDVQKMENEVGDTVQLETVMLIGGENIQVGTPFVRGATVTAEVIRQARSRKVIVFKRKPGAYRKKNGHRQHYTALKIQEIKY